MPPLELATHLRVGDDQVAEGDTRGRLVVDAEVPRLVDDKVFDERARHRGVARVHVDAVQAAVCHVACKREDAISYLPLQSFTHGYILRWFNSADTK